MTLEEHIEDIRQRLEQNIFKSEAAVRQGIVDPLLRSLGWPTDDTLVVFPEYSVGSGQVDYALCHPSSTPRVFIEAKQVGNIKGAEEQLFGYDSRLRVPIAVLTDGREWQFFHPTGEGTWAERKVCELDLITGDSQENAERLNRYLNYESIRTNEAVEAIKKDYEKVVQQRQIATRLPEVWNELVQEKNEDLLLVVMDAAKNKTGYEPTEEQVLSFLKSLKKETELDQREVRPLPIPPTTFLNRRSNVQSKAPAKRLVVTMPNREIIQHHNTMDTFREVIFKLGPEAVLEVDVEHMLISTEPIPKRRTAPYHGYHITENHGTPAKQKFLERIASRLGIQMKVEIVDKL